MLNGSMPQTGAIADSDPDIFTLKSGVKIRISGAPPMVFHKIREDMPTILPPKAIDRESGVEYDDFENLDYKVALAARERDFRAKTIDAALLFGTTIVYIPDDLPAIESLEWRERLPFINVTVDERYPRIAWMRYFALKSIEEINGVLLEVLRRTTTMEADVAESMARFPGDAVRPTDTGDSITNEN